MKRRELEMSKCHKKREMYLWHLLLNRVYAIDEIRNFKDHKDFIFKHLQWQNNHANAIPLAFLIKILECAVQHFGLLDRKRRHCIFHQSKKKKWKEDTRKMRTRPYKCDYVYDLLFIA